MKVFKIITGMIILLLVVGPVFASNQDHQEVRKAAQQAYRDGNWKEAYTQYQKLCLHKFYQDFLLAMETYFPPMNVLKLFVGIQMYYLRYCQIKY